MLPLSWEFLPHDASQELHLYRGEVALLALSPRRGPQASRAIQPEIDGLVHAGRRLPGERDLASFTGGGVACINRLHHDQPIFTRGPRGFLAADAAGEVS